MQTASCPMCKTSSSLYDINQLSGPLIGGMECSGLEEKAVIIKSELASLQYQTEFEKKDSNRKRVTSSILDVALKKERLDLILSGGYVLSYSSVLLPLMSVNNLVFECKKPLVTLLNNNLMEICSSTETKLLLQTSSCTQFPIPSVNCDVRNVSDVVINSGGSNEMFFTKRMIIILSESRVLNSTEIPTEGGDITAVGHSCDSDSILIGTSLGVVITFSISKQIILSTQPCPVTKSIVGIVGVKFGSKETIIMSFNEGIAFMRNGQNGWLVKGVKNPKIFFIDCCNTVLLLYQSAEGDRTVVGTVRNLNFPNFEKKEFDVSFEDLTDGNIIAIPTKTAVIANKNRIKRRKTSSFSTNLINDQCIEEITEDILLLYSTSSSQHKGIVFICSSRFPNCIKQTIDVSDTIINISHSDGKVAIVTTTSASIFLIA